MKYVAPLALLLTISLAPPRFEPVQPDLLSTGGAFVNAWADFDGDGRPDLFVGFGGATANRLYRNDNGVLVDVAQAAGIADLRGTLAAAWADYDGDGDPDLLVGLAPGPQSVIKLYRNDGGRFVDATRESGLARDSGRVRQAVWVDYDGDGDLDVFVAFRDRANAMFRNDAGHFTDVAAAIGLADTRRTVGAVWVDYDEDGDLDLVVANMDGDANAVMRNDGGHFTDVAASLGLAWGGREPNNPMNGTVRPCAADVNNDGHIDLFMANYGKNGLFLNHGKGRFTDASAAWKVDVDGRYDTCAFADFDNDGHLDLYVNGTVTGGTSYRDYLFRNTGTELADVTPDNIKALDADHGVQWADFDGDGDEDLALVGTQATGMHLVMRNGLEAGPNAGWLRVSVVDENGKRSLAGAEVRVYAAGTKRLLGTREVDAGSGYNSQNDMPLQFGLGKQQMVDVEVIVPRGGARTAALVRGVDARTWAKCAVTLRVTADSKAHVEGTGCHSVRSQGARESLIVSSSWLAAHLEDPNLVILHVGARAQYDSAHIRGARFVALDDISVSDRTGTGNGLSLELPAADDLRQRLVALGISDNSRIVVYHETDRITTATRVIFTLDYAGLGATTSLLDGGIEAWKRDGNAVTQAVPSVRPGTLSALKTRPIVVTADEVAARLAKPHVAVVDARAPEYYDGTQAGGRGSQRAGHIDGARSIPFTAVTDAALKLLPTMELEALFAKAGVQAGDTVITYCHIGQQATATLFAARTLGHPVLLYDGSFEDWSRRSQLPVEKKKP